MITKTNLFLERNWAVLKKPRSLKRARGLHLLQQRRVMNAGALWKGAQVYLWQWYEHIHCDAVNSK